MRILAVFAHPDDETFGPGGTLARYAIEGHTVHLRTFTRGEAGTLGPARYLSRTQLAELRTKELNCAAAALHAASLEIYGLPDGNLAEVPDDTGIGFIRQALELLKPDVLVTFHREGISGHPDHKTVARWSLKAVQEKERPVRLLGYGISTEQAARVKFRRLLPIPDSDIRYTIDVSSALESKLSAIRCHKSQSELWEKIKSADGGFQVYAAREHFCQTWPEVPAPSPILTRLEDAG
jgi:LmbE family N-acetylglucosaminyl deacetylase